MANQRALDPNASPYLQIPTTRFYVYVFPHPLLSLPVQFSTYDIQLQPSPRKSKKINLSLTPVPSGPRIPKSRMTTKIVRFGNEMKWRPKKEEKLGFEGRRWKNSRGEYHEILPLETNTTSLMIKNIPNKYTRKLLIQTLDAHCEAENKNGGSLSAYDFLYLPIDFKRRLNAGFAFVNFTNPEAALRFRNAFNGKRWELFGSKVAEISRARIQGKTALIENCKGMNFSYGSDEDMPVWFAPARDGSGEVRRRMFTVGRCLSWCT